MGFKGLLSCRYKLAAVEVELMRDSSLPMKRRVLYSFREGNRRDESSAKTKG
jgi:hypothetical protein